MQAVNRDATEDALRLIDDSHARLLDDRRTLQAVEAALRDLEPVPQDRGDTFVGPLARRLGIRPATLRKMGTRRPGPAAPRPADGLPGLQPRRRTRRPAGPPAAPRRPPAGADRPADRPGPLRRRRRTTGVDAARLARPPHGQGPRHAHRRRRVGRLPPVAPGPTPETGRVPTAPPRHGRTERPAPLRDSRPRAGRAFTGGADAQLRRAFKRQNSLPSGSARQCQGSSPVWPTSAGRAPSFRRRSSSAS